MRLITLIGVLAVLAAPVTLFAQETQPQIVPADVEDNGQVAPTTQAAEGEQAPPTTRQPGNPLGENWVMFLLLGLIVVMFIMSSRSKKKQQAQRQQMIAGMKKGDKVTTIGGIIGTVIETKDGEVVVKVDEQNNIHMRFVPSAIHHVGEPSPVNEDKK